MITWQVHRAKETPKKTLYVSIILGVFILFLIIFYGLVWAILAMMVLFASLNAYFLPTTYTLTESDILVDKKLFKNKLEWSRFRKYYITTTGIVLSPFSKRNLLDNFRGIHILLPKEKSDEIINFIKNKLSPASFDNKSIDKSSDTEKKTPCHLTKGAGLTKTKI